MTTPLSLVQRAQQGDAVAIAVLMNDALQAQDVWVKATLDRDCLQVMFKAPTVLHQAHCVEFIRRGLLRLQPESINRVTAYGWRVGDVFPLWIAAFALESTSSLPPHSLSAQAVSVTERAVLEQLPDHASVTSDSQTHATPTALQAPAPPPRLSSKAFKQHSELFKLGFVIVLTTVVYFVVVGV